MTITKIVYHPIAILTITIVSILFFVSLDKSSKKTQSSSENIRVLENDVNKISNEIIILEEKIEETQTEQFKEKVLRNELLLQKPGEYILQIPENSSNEQEDTCLNTNCNKLTNPQRISALSAWVELLF